MRTSFRSFIAGAVLAASALFLTGMAYGPAHDAVIQSTVSARLKGSTPVNVLVQQLNGAPTAPGNITTGTGADVDSSAVAAGSCLMIQCTTDTYVLPGTAVAATGATRGILLLGDTPPFQMCLLDSQTQFSTLAKTTAGTCGYWVMQ